MTSFAPGPITYHRLFPTHAISLSSAQEVNSPPPGKKQKTTKGGRADDDKDPIEKAYLRCTRGKDEGKKEGFAGASSLGGLPSIDESGPSHVGASLGPAFGADDGEDEDGSRGISSGFSKPPR